VNRARKLLDGVDKSWRWPYRFLVEIHYVTQFDGIQIAPHRALAQNG